MLFLHEVTWIRMGYDLIIFQLHSEAIYNLV